MNLFHVSYKVFASKDKKVFSFMDLIFAILAILPYLAHFSTQVTR